MYKLQRALYQHTRLDVLCRLVCGDDGCDHSSFAVYAVRTLAAGDKNLFEKLLPEHIGVARQGHPANVAIANVIMGLWYANEAILAEGLKLARKCQTIKSETALVKTVLRYLIALAEKDMDSANAALHELCRTINRDKEGWLRPTDNPLADSIALFPHGLYQLAYLVLDDAQTFERLDYPLLRFDKEYAAWLTHADAPGEPLVRLAGELSILNDLITSIPETQLFSEKREVYYDADASMKSLRSGLAARGIDLEAHFRHYNG
jgi:hypothetical protein